MLLGDEDWQKVDGLSGVKSHGVVNQPLSAWVDDRTQNFYGKGPKACLFVVGQAPLIGVEDKSDPGWEITVPDTSADNEPVGTIGIDESARWFASSQDADAFTAALKKDQSLCTTSFSSIDGTTFMTKPLTDLDFPASYIGWTFSSADRPSDVSAVVVISHENLVIRLESLTGLSTAQLSDLADIAYGKMTKLLDAK